MVNWYAIAALLVGASLLTLTLRGYLTGELWERTGVVLRSNSPTNFYITFLLYVLISIFMISFGSLLIYFEYFRN